MEKLETVTTDAKPILMTSVPPEGICEDGASYIWLLFAVLTIIIALSALVTYMARNRGKIVNYYSQGKFRESRNGFRYLDDEDSDVSIARGDDFGEDNATECLLKGKLQISNNRENYQSTQVTHLATVINSDLGNNVLNI